MPKRRQKAHIIVKLSVFKNRCILKFKAVAIDSRLSQGIQWLLTAGCQQRIRYCQPAVTSEFAADSQ